MSLTRSADCLFPININFIKGNYKSETLYKSIIWVITLYFNPYNPYKAYNAFINILIH